MMSQDSTLPLPPVPSEPPAPTPIAPPAPAPAESAAAPTAPPAPPVEPVAPLPAPAVTPPVEPAPLVEAPSPPVGQIAPPLTGEAPPAAEATPPAPAGEAPAPIEVSGANVPTPAVPATTTAPPPAGPRAPRPPRRAPGPAPAPERRPLLPPRPARPRPIDTHTLNVLEFDAVREILASFATSALGQSMALVIRPSTDPAWVASALAQTTEMRTLLEQQLNPPLAGLRDVRPLLDEPARTGAPLEPAQLADIARTLAVSAALKQFFADLKVEVPHLQELIHKLVKFDAITDAFEKAIDADATVRDDASPKLTEIRRDMARLMGAINQKLQAILSNPDLRGAIENRNVLLRGGKAVIAVLATHRARVPGVVLDRSSSGATLFIEPEPVIELSNELDDRLHDEKQEVAQILWTLTRLVLDQRLEVLDTLRMLARIDLTYAKAQFSVDYCMSGPEVRDAGVLQLRNARHPLLIRLKTLSAARERRTGPGAGRERTGARAATEARGESVTAERPAGAEAAAPAELEPDSGSPGEPAEPNAAPVEAPAPSAPPPPPASSETRGAKPRPADVLDRVVPISPRLGDDFDLLVVTGPNTGGKTVTLKTIGLLALMAQSGLHIPADAGSVMPVYRQIFADIGDEQSIQQSLSTFSSHMAQITRILRYADRDSLVLLDELGSGTDPDEGAALGTAILDGLHEVGAKAVVTTHLENLRAYAGHNPRAQNASVEFDVRTLRPTYHLVLGQFGSSNALEIARSLGMPRGIISRARALLSRRGGRASELIQQVQATRATVEKRRAEVDALFHKAHEMKLEAYKLLNRVDEERADAQEQAYLEIDWITLKMRELLGQFLGQVHDVPPPWTEHIRAFEQKLGEIVADTPLAKRQAAFIDTLKVGDAIWARTFRKPGTILRIRKNRQTVNLDIGGIEYEVPFAEVGRVPQA